MTTAIVVSDLSFIQRSGRKNAPIGVKELKGKLKYFEFRDDRDGTIPQQRQIERWQDRGLGRNYKEIFAKLNQLGSTRLLAWTWVVSPAPDLMATLPEDARKYMVSELTERLVEAYYTARGVDVPEYSFVLHDRNTEPVEANNGESMQQLHTHVVLPATVPTVDGSRIPFDNRAAKGHLQLLQDVGTANFEILLDQYLAPEWRLMRPERYLDTELTVQADHDSTGEATKLDLPESAPELEIAPLQKKKQLTIGR